MSHIYIHIPFCPSKCAYCDFYSIASQKWHSEYIEALLSEIQKRKNEVNKSLKSIYLGGGTPSFLSIKHLDKIFKSLYSEFIVDSDIEITLEANPENVSKENCTAWQDLGVNRLSIGVQSFNDRDLKYLQRKHDGKTALKAIETALKSGFDNLSIDLIHGIPCSSNSILKNNIIQLHSLEIPHISMYSLTLEKNTILEKLIQKNKRLPIDEDQQSQQFQLAIEEAKKLDYQHYEISNFCKSGFKAIHNTAYWKGAEYCGFGPAAHSFNGKTRRWNVSDLQKYMSKLKENKLYYETESIDKTKAYNEFILTRLRLSEGFSIKEFTKLFTEEKLEKLKAAIKGSEYYESNKDRISLNEKGFLFADKLISDLIIVE